MIYKFNLINYTNYVRNYVLIMKICIVQLYEKTQKAYQFLTRAVFRVYTWCIKPDAKPAKKL